MIEASEFWDALRAAHAADRLLAPGDIDINEGHGPAAGSVIIAAFERRGWLHAVLVPRSEFPDPLASLDDLKRFFIDAVQPRPVG